jgi:hypothetical protein
VILSAHGSVKAVSEIVDAGAVAHLLNCLSSQSPKLVEASSRALRTIFQYPYTKLQVHDESLKVLISHLNPVEPTNVLLRISELAASILARVAVSKEMQAQIFKAGALFPLVSLIENHSTVKLQEAALDAISSLCFDNYEIVVQLSQLKSIFQMITL